MRVVLSVIYEPDRDEFLVIERSRRSGWLVTSTLAAFRRREDAHAFLHVVLDIDPGNALGVLDQPIQPPRSTDTTDDPAREANG